MKAYVCLFVVVLLACLLFGCINRGAPSCSGSDAKDLVVQIASKAERDKLATAYALQFGDSQAQVQVALGGKITYDDVVSNKIGGASAEVKAAIDKALKAQTFTLDQIVTTSKNAEFKKSMCSAQLTIKQDGQPFTGPITYELQYTDDGKQLLASVRGL